MPDTVEVMHDRSLTELAAFLEERQGYYDLIWIARTHNLDRILPRLERITPGTGKPPRVVLDTEAIAALREAERRRLPGRTPFDLDAAILKEFANAHLCQNITAVNQQEAPLLATLASPTSTWSAMWRDFESDAAGVRGTFWIAVHRRDPSAGQPELRWAGVVRRRGAAADRAAAGLGDAADGRGLWRSRGVAGGAPRASAHHAARRGAGGRCIAVRRASYFRRPDPIRGGHALQGV